MPDYYLQEQIWNGQVIAGAASVTKQYTQLPPGLLIEIYATATDEYCSIKVTDDNLNFSVKNIFHSDSIHRDGAENVSPYRFFTSATSITITVKNRGSGNRSLNLWVKMLRAYGASRQHIWWETLQIAAGGTYTSGYMQPGLSSRLGIVINSDSTAAGTLIIQDRLNSLATQQLLASWSTARGTNLIIPNAFGEFKLLISNAEAAGTFNYLLSVIEIP